MGLMDSVVQPTFNSMTSVLFVCLGNICRSPAAEGILRDLAAKRGFTDLRVESCGLARSNVGYPPDSRMQEAARRRKILLTGYAQQFDLNFFDSFDYILAVDHKIIKSLNNYADSAENKAKLHLITDFSKTYQAQDIPDPFYQGNEAFEHVLDMLEDACNGFLDYLQNVSG